MSHVWIQTSTKCAPPLTKHPASAGVASKRVRIIAPTARYSDSPLFPRPITPTAHFSDNIK